MSDGSSPALLGLDIYLGCDLTERGNSLSLLLEHEIVQRY